MTDTTVDPRVTDTRTVGQVEQEVADILAAELGPWLQWVIQIHKRVQEVRLAVPPIRGQSLTPELEATSLLFTRVVNDLRSLTLLAVHGYPAQAATIGAGMFETCFSLIVLTDSGDGKLACKWLAHDNPRHSWIDAASLISMAMKPIAKEQPEKVIQAKKLYAQLSMAKHANPLMQRRLGLSAQEGIIRAYAGPDPGQAAVQVAWFTLQKCGDLALAAAMCFLKVFWSIIPEESREGLINPLAELMVASLSLVEEGVSRWGSEDWLNWTFDRQPR